MNRIYRVIWNTSRCIWQVACELGSHQKKTHRKHLSLSIITAGSLLLVSVDALAALPTNGSVVAGSGSISQTSQDMTVNQSSQNMVINWDSFSIGKDNSVTFVQPNVSSAVLNRVTGDSVSEIRGMLSANGRVFLINPNGVVFSSTAQVDVGALVASTQGISNSDFMSGNYTFSGTSDNAVINNGNIVTSNGGVVALIAAKIVNTGDITTTEGATLMGAGTTVTLDLGGTVSIAVSKSLYETYVKNGGVIQADGGLIYLTAKAADALTSSVINNTGVLQAQTLGTDDTGQIVLMGDLDSGSVTVSGTLDASAPNGGDGGSIETSAASVKINDDAAITAAATDGEAGTWLIDPADFTIYSGNGEQTTSGIGATTLETSLSYGLTVSLQTLDGDGDGDINVDADVTYAAGTLVLDAYNDININAAITASGSAGLDLVDGDQDLDGYTDGGGDYTFSDDGSINLSDGTTLQINGNYYTLITNATELAALNGDSGHYALANDLDLESEGTYDSAVIGTFNGTLAGLGHTISDLAISSTDDYLGLIGTLEDDGVIRDIHLSDVDVEGNTSLSSDVGGLVGKNDGGTITGSSVSGTVSGYQYIGGLVGYDTGSISDSYATGNVTGDYSDVGGLVGYDNSGSITDSYATGAVTGYNLVGGLVGSADSVSITDSYAIGKVTGDTEKVGGLAGSANSGSITDSYATGAVTGGNYVGGLVGYNINETITDGHATGAVTGDNSVGGLVGENDDGSITDSYATGTVTCGENSNCYNVGGLVGFNYGGSITDSYASGDVTGEDSEVGGLVGSNYGGSITDSHATGAVTGEESVGGLVGYSSGAISGSYATGAVTSDDDVGGLVGYNTGSISDSYASGAVTCEGNSDCDNFGGLVGNNNGNGSITNSYATGAVTGEYEVGGLVGVNYGPITGSYATGAVTGDEDVGGLVGLNDGAITDSYATGAVTGDYDDVGGLVGYNFDVTITDSFYATTNSDGESIDDDYTNTYGTGVTYAQLLDADTFASWDISSIGGTGATWRIYDGYTTPLLSSFLTEVTVSTDTTSLADKVYDGTTGIDSSIDTDWATSDDSDFDSSLVSGELALDSKNTGTRSVVSGYYSTQNGYDIIVDNSITDLTVTVTPKTIDAISGITAADKTYDGTTTATLDTDDATSSDIISGDDISVTATGTFADKNAGTDKTVSVSDITLSGEDASNYVLEDTTATTTASISQKVIDSISGITAADKTYDGTTTATLDTDNATVSDVIDGDDVSVASATGTFSDKNAGTDKTVSVSDITLSGNDASNYVLESGYTATTTAGINQRALTVTADDVSKAEGSVDPALTYTTGCGSLTSDCGLVSGDVLTGALSRATGESAGTYSITQGTLDNANYAITYTPGVFTIESSSATDTTGPSAADLRQVEPTLTVLEQDKSELMQTTAADSALAIRYVDSAKDITSASNDNASLYVVHGGIKLVNFSNEKEE